MCKKIMFLMFLFFGMLGCQQIKTRLFPANENEKIVEPIPAQTIPTTNREEKTEAQKPSFETVTAACTLEQQAAVSAISMRDQGQSKSQLLAPLPKPSDTNNPLATAMYSIVEDIYAYPQLASFPYFAYRSELCFRRVEKEPIPASFSLVAEEVLACQNKFGKTSSEPLINCVREAIIKAAQK